MSTDQQICYYYWCYYFYNYHHHQHYLFRPWLNVWGIIGPQYLLNEWMNEWMNEKWRGIYSLTANLCALERYWKLLGNKPSLFFFFPKRNFVRQRNDLRGLRPQPARVRGLTQSHVEFRTHILLGLGKKGKRARFCANSLWNKSCFQGPGTRSVPCLISSICLVSDLCCPLSHCHTLSAHVHI